MSFLKNAKIRTKMLSVLIPLCVIGLTACALISVRYKQTDTVYSAFINLDNAATLELARGNRNVAGSVVGAYQAMVYTKSDPMFQSAETEYRRNSKAVFERFANARASLPSQSDTIDSIAADAKSIVSLTDTAFELGKADRNDEALQMLKKADALYLPFVKKISDFMNMQTAMIKEKSDALSYQTSSTILTSLTIVAGTFAIGIIVALMIISKGISTPIAQLRRRMTTLSSGDTQAEIDGQDRRDEVGQMAAAVVVFRDNALERSRLEAEATANRSLSEEERRQTAEADRKRAQAMAQATEGLGEGLKHLAAGNLSVQLSDPFAAEFETLRANFNGAVGQLAETLRSVAASTSAIDTGSREVSASADDLSKRTEQQAASLEETAAALDQITANVANSSKRADEARTVAIQANESAAQSGRVVADAVNAMQKIEQSSNQVSNIIGVIDEIAFQTNLLVLNAGVEAARAGEAGKGFAVVAQEVRELAQRSAQAAKEIKDLIRNSSVEVQSGVKLVSQTGEALKTIEGYIVTVNQHVDSIATSAREQSVGLAEVNTAVNQMDQVTQQNAAMVEETSAAGASLAGECGRLRELVAQFQLGGALRQTADVMAAGARHSPVASPARRLSNKIASAFNGNAAVKESWEEF